LLLLVAGEPDNGQPPLKDVQRPLVRLFFGIGLPAWQRKRAEARASEGRRDPAPGAEGEPRMRLPPDQAGCVREVVSIARQEGATVSIVDVNQPAGFQALVARWVGPNDVLPILVRPDGARLEGIEEFGPRRVRRFIRGK